ncbi:MAG: methyl-accepting chemotaxis protein [Desulfobacterales bacterium]|nr:methyl-accepting chemotaxis protein [Desulfobacterales bacterium]MDD4071383.1 methyl-accepting chemotaxis protein [Desulfobacterales bacterium]MDD4391428.1 methyl-accepting chemotaxis protein [Desulfobacterales bacterium]
MITIFNKLLRRTRLRGKILVTTIVIVVFFMGLSLVQSLSLHKQTAMDQLANFSNDLIGNTYSTVRSSMIVGQSNIVKTQLKDIKNNMGGVHFYITDFKKLISYASEDKRIDQNMNRFFGNDELSQALDQSLKTGIAPERSWQELDTNIPFLTTIKPILNESACFHCHGSSRKILGAMVIKQPVTGIYTAIRNSRNELILYFAGSLVGLVLIINFMFSKLVTQRIRSLEEQANKLAAGDINITADDDYIDSIGRLARNFNLMVKNIKDRMEYANSLKLGISDPFFMADPEMKITYFNAAAEQMTGIPAGQAIGKTCQEVFGTTTSSPFKKVIETGTALLGQRITVTDSNGREIPVMTSASLLRDSSGKILGGFEIIRDLTTEVEAENRLQEAYLREEKAKQAMEDKVHELSEILARVGQGDFTMRAAETGANDAMDILTTRINKTLDGIVSLITQVKSHIIPVLKGIMQISQGNQSLSQRTKQQASVMEEISSTLEQLVSNTSQNLNNTRHADTLSKEALDVAKAGGKQIEKTARAMVEMSEASKKIVEMMDLINEITFQTNLLSINAAIEAARAGEQGRGFAVVANEVRNLAKRSTAASKNIKDLVREILNTVTKSGEWVEELKTSFAKIMTTAEQVSIALNNVSVGTEESATGIEQISEGTARELVEVNEQNAVFVDEIARETQKLKEKSEQLKNITEIFNLGETNQPDELDDSGYTDTRNAFSFSGKEKRSPIPFGDSLQKNIIHKSNIDHLKNDLLEDDFEEEFEEY